MLVKNWIGAAVVALLCLVIIPAAQAQAQYMGSESCFNCHPTEFNDWKVSGHPYKLVPVDDASVRPIPLPSGIRFNDVTYVIGGYKWKSRYVDTEGYIITTVFSEEDGSAIPGMNQYNNFTGEWSNYHAGELNKPYNCGSCHTTGWVADEDWETDGTLEDNQDGLPGMHGTFEFGGIHCEECHGPGNTMAVDDSAAACGSCHFRGDIATIPASGGFIRHHEQYNEQLASPHQNFRCVTCHNPHKRAEFSIVRTCSDCHPSQAASYAMTSMGAVGVTCEDCHMPYASKSAQALGPYKGDVRTHLFSINSAKNGEMFTEGGGFVLLDAEGQGAVTLDFACMDCHPNRNMNWLAKNAKDFHDQDAGGKTAPVYATGSKPSDFRGSRKNGG